MSRKNGRPDGGTTLELKPEKRPLNMETQSTLSELRAAPYLVLSLYLDADGRTQEVKAIRSRAHSLLHRAHEELERRWHELEHDVRESARKDLEECRTIVDELLPRGACRGLALFSCSGRGFLESYVLPRPVQDRTVWDTDPLILPTLRLLENYPRTGIILVDHEKARFFASRLGEVAELLDVDDEVPGKVKEAGLLGLQERQIERHVEWHVHEHIKHVAEVAKEVFRSWPMTWLLVGGNPEMFEDLRQCLDYRMRDRWAKDLDIETDAPFEKVQKTVLAAVEELDQKRENELMQQLYDAWRSRGLGVVGLDETLRALYYDEVGTLVIDSELRMQGRRCGACGMLTRADDRCPSCGSEALGACADLADEAAEDTLARGGQVEIVGRHDEFRIDGGVGALLRFKPPDGNLTSCGSVGVKGEEVKK
jgi:peptide chain release factor subunit 1